MEEARNRFFRALANDFNTPAALAALFDWIAEANRRFDAGESFGADESFERMLYCLGFERLLEADDAPPADAVRLLDEREAARSRRDFAEADRKRDELGALGFEVRDTPAGPQLVRR